MRNSPKIFLGVVAGLALVAAGGLAGSDRKAVFAARAEVELRQAQTEFQSHPGDAPAAWHFARACFDSAEFATNKAGRAAIARQGIAACRQVIARDTNSAAAHYYLGMNLGQLARTETLGALKLVREMEREFKITSDLDEHFDYAGADRNLGLLYRDAPGWPLSIGNRRKARQWLGRAVEFAPAYPENRLNLIESRLQWNDRAAAERELKELEALWPRAQTNFTGAAWEQSWADWTSRKAAVEESLAQSPKSVTSPKNPQ